MESRFSVVNISFFIIFAVFDPSPLTVSINCSFYIYNLNYNTPLLY